MTSAMAVFCTCVGREAELENELVMGERGTESETARVSERMWRCNNSIGYDSEPVRIHGKLENLCFKWK